MSAVAEAIAALPGVKSAELTCPSMPVQLQGQLEDGSWWYYRSRSDLICLAAARSFEDAVETAMDNRLSGVCDHYGMCSDAETLQHFRDLIRDGWPTGRDHR